MAFVELTDSKNKRFLIDFNSGWEVRDNGDDPALFVNHAQGRNLDTNMPYEDVKAKLIQKKIPAIVSIGGGGGCEIKA